MASFVQSEMLVKCKPVTGTVTGNDEKFLLGWNVMLMSKTMKESKRCYWKYFKNKKKIIIIIIF
jgi:hypothetical protein